MQRYVIFVGSITYAIKGRDLLRKQGIRAYVERKTNSEGSSSCGYVIVAEGNRKRIVDILKYSGIKITELNTIA